MIAVACNEPLPDDVICGVTLENKGDMVVDSITTQRGDTAPSGGGEAYSFSGEPHPGLETEIEQPIMKAAVMLPHTHSN